MRYHQRSLWRTWTQPEGSINWESSIVLELTLFAVHHDLVFRLRNR